MKFQPMQGTLRARLLLRWSKLYVLVILASAGLVQSTDFVPLVQKEGLCISEDLRGKIQEACEKYLADEKDAGSTPKNPNVPCHSKDIPLAKLGQKLVTQLYDEIENIKKPLLEEYTNKLRENKEYARAQLESIKKHYQLDDEIANTFMPEDIQLEFPDIGFKCVPVAQTFMDYITGTGTFEWLRNEPPQVEQDRSKATSDSMVICKMYSAEKVKDHGCVPHRDLVTFRTNKGSIPVVLSVSICEPEGDVEALRYAAEHFSGTDEVEGKMIPLNRKPGQVTLIPPGVGHDVVPPKTGKRISMVILCELMTPTVHKEFLKDREVQNVPCLLRNVVKDLVEDAVKKSEHAVETHMKGVVDCFIENAEVLTTKALTTATESDDTIPNEDAEVLHDSGVSEIIEHLTDDGVSESVSEEIEMQKFGEGGIPNGDAASLGLEQKQEEESSVDPGLPNQDSGTHQQIMTKS